MTTPFPVQSGLAFERPLIALSVIVILPLALFLARRLGGRFAAAVPLGAPGGTPFRSPLALAALARVLRFAEICAAALLLIAAAGPVARTAETVWLGRGADAVFVLDVSPSMAALDMGGASRFDAARDLITGFAERRPADGIGLVAFGTDAALLLPPTADGDALRERLAGLQVGELGDATAIGMGLAIAAGQVARSAAPRRTVVLISDGENNAGAIHPETAAAMIRDAGASLWVIGVGTGGVVPIDFTDPFTRVRHTGMYDSAFDTDTLRRIAEAGGGEWTLAPSADAFAAAVARIDEREAVVLRSGVTTSSRPLHPVLLALALALSAVPRLLRRLLLGAWL